MFIFCKESTTLWIIEIKYLMFIFLFLMESKSNTDIK